jgi:hypothetical protein
VTTSFRSDIRILRPISLLPILFVALIARSAAAQTSDPGPPQAAAQAPDAGAPQSASPPSAAPRDETELNVIALPTTQSMRRFGSHFRITHRFTRELGRGNFGDLASDLFGLDEGAVIGLDYRFAPTSNIQVAAYRTVFNQTVQFSSRWDALRQGEHLPIAISALVSVEGTQNFREDHSPALGVVVSRTYGRRFAFYASPTFVWNSVTPMLGTETQLVTDDDNTSYIGLAARVMLPKTTYIAGEFTPRLSGFMPNRSTWGVAIEKHTRGHLFQLNFTNGFGTTYGQLARGGAGSNVYLGFNIARKF